MKAEHLDLRYTILAYHGAKAVLGTPFGRTLLVDEDDATRALAEGHLLHPHVVDGMAHGDGTYRLPRLSNLGTFETFDPAAEIPRIDTLVTLTMFTPDPADPIWLVAGHDPVTGHWLLGGVFSEAEVDAESTARRHGRGAINRVIRHYLDLDETRRGRRVMAALATLRGPGRP